MVTVVVVVAVVVAVVVVVVVIVVRLRVVQLVQGHMVSVLNIVKASPAYKDVLK